MALLFHKFRAASVLKSRSDQDHFALGEHATRFPPTSALFLALEQTHCARMWFYMSEKLFIARFWISTEVVYLQRLHGWCRMKLLPSRHVLCTPYNHAPCHFMQSHISKVNVCLAVTRHLHFWQNDWDLLRATAVTRRWNGHWNATVSAWSSFAC